MEALQKVKDSEKIIIWKKNNVIIGNKIGSERVKPPHQRIKDSDSSKMDFVLKMLQRMKIIEKLKMPKRTNRIYDFSSWLPFF